MKKNIFVLLSAFFIASNGFSQNAMINGIDFLPQSSKINPAQPYSLKYHVGIPLLSGVHLNMQNTAFSASDLFKANTDVNKNVDRVINDMSSKDYIYFKNRLDILDFGFNTKLGYFSFGSNITTSFYLDYPVELLKLTRFNGTNYVGEDLSMTDVKAEAISYVSTHIGFQKRFLDDKLSLGLRYKYLTGLAHGYVDRLNLEIDRVDNFNLNLKVDALVRTSGVQSLSDGDVPTGNNGHAIDFGAYYQVNDKLNIGASVVDFGFIKWNDLIDYKANGSYNYSGLQVDLNDDDPFDEGFDKIVDDIEAGINYSEDTLRNGSYTRSLNTQINLSATYQVNDKVMVGGLYNLQSVNNNWIQNLSVNAHYSLLNALHLLGAVNVNKAQPKVGLGFMVTAGSFQFYAVNDNVVNTFNYGNLKALNMSFGMNIAVRKKERVFDEDGNEIISTKKKVVRVTDDSSNKKDKEAKKEVQLKEKEAKEKAKKEAALAKKEAKEKAKQAKKEALNKKKEEEKKKEEDVENEKSKSSTTPSLPKIKPNTF
ncbi:MAG: DUF5723 family protein [Flavobacteriales bacterium]